MPCADPRKVYKIHLCREDTKFNVCFKLINITVIIYGDGG